MYQIADKIIGYHLYDIKLHGISASNGSYRGYLIALKTKDFVGNRYSTNVCV